MSEYCDTRDYSVSYLEYAITIPVVIILQLALLLNTILKELKHDKKNRSKIVSIRVLFIVLQLLSLLELFNDLLRIVIDPYTLMLRGNILCDMVAIGPKLITTTYYGVYLIQILLRLHIGFKNSFLAMSKATIIILSSFIIMFSIIHPILLIFSMHTACLWSWKPTDFAFISNDDNFSFCSTPNIGSINLFIMTGVIWIAITNIIFGVVFGIKLKNTLKLTRVSLSSNNKDKNLKLKALIIKNTILTLIGSISTIVFWISFLISQNGTGGNGIFIHLDLYINCIVIALMFQYNDKYYKRFCKCCIIICLRDCDKSYDKTDEQQQKERQQYVEDYLHNIDLFELSMSVKQLRIHSNSMSDIGSNVDMENDDEYGHDIKLSDIVGSVDMKHVGICNDNDDDESNAVNYHENERQENKGKHPQHLSMADIVTNTTINC